MDDRIRMPCPSCGNTLNVRREYVGKVASCKRCEHTFTIRIPDDRALEPPAPDLPVPSESLSMAAWGAAPTESDLAVASRADELERRNAQLQTELVEARDTLLRVEEERAARQIDRQAQDAEWTSLLRQKADEADKLERANAQIRAELDEAREAMKRLEEARADDEAERLSLVSEWTSRWEHENEDATQLQAQADLLQTRLDEAHTQLEVERDTSKRLGEESLALRSEVDRLQREIEQGSGALREAQERFEAHRGLWDSEREELKGNTSANFERQSRHQDALDQIGQHEAVNQEQASARMKLESEVAELKSQIATLTEEVKLSRDSKTQMVDFLAGLGIRFPD